MHEQFNREQQEFFGSEEGGADQAENLWQYVQSLNPDIIEQLSRPQSKEVFHVMERNIVGLLGGLPSEQFGVTINTSREHLGKLLASAMMSGYFLRNAEQRMAFERTMHSNGGLAPSDE